MCGKQLPSGGTKVYASNPRIPGQLDCGAVPATKTILTVQPELKGPISQALKLAIGVSNEDPHAWRRYGRTLSAGSCCSAGRYV
jgi:hypothetical protein